MTAQNKRIEFVPQGANPQTEKLKLCIAIELLYKHCQAMEIIMMGEPDAYSDEDFINYIQSVEFLQMHGGKKMNAPTYAESILDSRDALWRASAILSGALSYETIHPKK